MPRVTTSEWGAQAPASTEMPHSRSFFASSGVEVASVFTRRVIGAGPLLKRVHCSVTSNPYRSYQRATSHPWVRHGNAQVLEVGLSILWPDREG